MIAFCWNIKGHNYEQYVADLITRECEVICNWSIPESFNFQVPGGYLGNWYQLVFVVCYQLDIINRPETYGKLKQVSFHKRSILSSISDQLTNVKLSISLLLFCVDLTFNVHLAIGVFRRDLLLQKSQLIQSKAYGVKFATSQKFTFNPLTENLWIVHSY